MIAVALLAVAANFAATPEQAVLKVYFPAGRARIVSTTRAGDYAVVVTRGGTIEASIDQTPILLEHFAFGWQPLELIDAPCQIAGHSGITTAQALQLSRDISPPKDVPNCTPGAGDRGPADDVAAIRKLAHRGLIPFAAVSGNFGFLSWYGAGGGEEFFKRVHGRWRKFLSGGGAMSARDAAMAGVPRSASRVFGLPDSFAAPRP